MPHSYIKFDSPISNAATTGRMKGLLQKIVSGIVSIFIPKANPDYDGLIDNVAQWLLEINEDDKTPNREIGIDEYGQALLIMPWRDNYGYWSDTGITVDYFKEHFKAVEIYKVDFDNKWDAFVKRNAGLPT